MRMGILAKNGGLEDVSEVDVYFERFVLRSPPRKAVTPPGQHDTHHTRRIRRVLLFQRWRLEESGTKVDTIPDDRLDGTPQGEADLGGVCWGHSIDWAYPIR